MSVFQIIITISAVLIALANIWNFFGRPIKFLGKKSKEQFHNQFIRELEENLPEWIDNHDKSFMNEISKEVVKQLQPNFDKINQQNDAQSKAIQGISKSSQDMLRKHILDIYENGKKDQTLTQSQKETLDELYADYDFLEGNGYVKKKYNRMKDWKIIQDE